MTPNWLAGGLGLFSSTLKEHSLIPESLRSLTILCEGRVTGAQPLALVVVVEAAGEGEGAWVWFSGRGVSRVGEEGWELRRFPREVMRPRARRALPVF